MPTETITWTSPTSSSAVAKKRKHKNVYDAPAKKPKTKSSSQKSATSVETKHDTGEFRRVHAAMTLSLAPCFAFNPKAGILEMLDSLIMRYVPALDGVVLAHSDLRLRGTGKAAIQAAKIKLSSVSHVGLLAHNTFNVSIPRHHIPLEEWVFQHGPAENDPEFGAGALADDYDTQMDGIQRELNGDAADALGTWVRADATSEPLGGEDSLVEFTVVGMKMAGNVFSLVGSLQPDPFSPEHAAAGAAAAAAQTSTQQRRHFPSSRETSPVPSTASPSEDQDDTAQAPQLNVLQLKALEFSSPSKAPLGAGIRYPSDLRDSEDEAGDDAEKSALAITPTSKPADAGIASEPEKNERKKKKKKRKAIVTSDGEDGARERKKKKKRNE